MRRKKNERGAGAVEFAIILPVLLVILFSLIDFGRYFYVRISLSSASFEVADAVSRGTFIPGADQKIPVAQLLPFIEAVSPGIAGFAQIDNLAQLSIDPPLSCPNTSNVTEVTLRTEFNAISPVFEFFTNESYFSEAIASTSMRCLR